jgi:hypothetical protein
VATCAALLSHLLGGGAVPGWLGLLVPWVLSLAVCTALAGRRLSLWRTTASVGLSQVLFHTLFVLGAPGSPGSTQTSGAARGTAGERPGGHGLHGDSLGHPSRHEPAPYLPDLLAADATMWFWHGDRAGGRDAVLVSGERTLMRLRELAGRTADRLRRRLPSPADLAPLLPVAPAVAPDWFTGSFPARPEVSPSRRRGPPSSHAT